MKTKNLLDYFIYCSFKYYLWITNICLLIIIFLFSYKINAVLKTMFLSAGPILFLNTLIYVYFIDGKLIDTTSKKYQIGFKTIGKSFKIENIKRGVSVIGSAGSGKTESVVYGFLRHFEKHQFCGIIHDYKDFEITEMAYPLFRTQIFPSKLFLLIKLSIGSILLLRDTWIMRKVSMKFLGCSLKTYWSNGNRE